MKAQYVELMGIKYRLLSIKYDVLAISIPPRGGNPAMRYLDYLQPRAAFEVYRFMRIPINSCRFCLTGRFLVKQAI